MDEVDEYDDEMVIPRIPVIIVFFGGGRSKYEHMVSCSKSLHNMTSERVWWCLMLRFPSLFPDWMRSTPCFSPRSELANTFKHLNEQIRHGEGMVYVKCGCKT